MGERTLWYTIMESFRRILKWNLLAESDKNDNIKYNNNNSDNS